MSVRYRSPDSAGTAGGRLVNPCRFWDRPSVSSWLTRLPPILGWSGSSRVSHRHQRCGTYAKAVPRIGVSRNLFRRSESARDAQRDRGAWVDPFRFMSRERDDGSAFMPIGFQLLGRNGTGVASWGIPFRTDADRTLPACGRAFSGRVRAIAKRRPCSPSPIEGSGECARVPRGPAGRDPR